mgnify:CR=1 FL=1
MEQVAFDIPSSLKIIDEKVFCGCSSLTQISIPSSVERIDSYAFEDCSSLLEITIPSSVSFIGSLIFMNCSSIEKVSILPKTISSGYDLFKGCSSLKQIIVPYSISELSIGNDYQGEIKRIWYFQFYANIYISDFYFKVKWFLFK